MKANVDEGLVNNTLQGSRLPCDADSVSTYCNQGYKARVLENGHHPHVLLLFEDLTEDDWQARAGDLHEFVVETQNQLEMCLPPAFFIYSATSHDSHGSSDTGAGPLLLA